MHLESEPKYLGARLTVVAKICLLINLVVSWAGLVAVAILWQADDNYILESALIASIIGMATACTWMGFQWKKNASVGYIAVALATLQLFALAIFYICLFQSGNKKKEQGNFLVFSSMLVGAMFLMLVALIIHNVFMKAQKFIANK